MGAKPAPRAGQDEAVGAVEFRVARAEDVPAVADVKVASWRSTYSDLIEADVLKPFLEPDRQRASLQHAIADPNTVLIVAEEGGLIIAFGIGEAPSGYIDSLHVSPGHRGDGVGRRLLGRLARALLELGCTELTLHVVSSNLRARQFYERLEAEFTGTAPASWASEVHEAHYLWRELHQLIRAAER